MKLKLKLAELEKRQKYAENTESNSQEHLEKHSLKLDSKLFQKSGEDDGESWVRWRVAGRVGEGAGKVGGKKGTVTVLISNYIITSSGFDLNAKVADLISENYWNWPSEWSDLFSEVIDVPVPVLSQDSVDKALWFNKKNEEVQFRHAFILWMALKGRLKTQDRISRWIGADNMVCHFCECCKHSHGYLFFQCGFAQGVWDRLKIMCRLEDLSFVWAKIISGISIRKANNTLWSIIQRLVFGAAVYFIWQEHNFRLFRSVERPADKVFDIIVDTARLRLLVSKIKRSCEVDKAVAIWKLPIRGVGEKGDFGVRYLWKLLFKCGYDFHGNDVFFFPFPCLWSPCGDHNE
nr:RNA-directed DNA polymerase, eukaryota, reverse transcriptase zinc-binding domain protein [Tanacetum cinerariifolium]